jgi:hypothetical protein
VACLLLQGNRLDYSDKRVTARRRRPPIALQRHAAPHSGLALKYIAQEKDGKFKDIEANFCIKIVLTIFKIP